MQRTILKIGILFMQYCNNVPFTVRHTLKLCVCLTAKIHKCTLYGGKKNEI